MQLAETRNMSRRVFFPAVAVFHKIGELFFCWKKRN